MKKDEPRLVLFDIENCPAKGWFYEMFKEGNIVAIDEQGYMLSFSYKVLGENKIHTYALPDFPGYDPKKKDDRALVKKLSEILSTADFVIAHNGDRFDLTVTNTRLVYHDLPPLPPFKTIDTLKIARSKFKFLSNKLDELAKFFDIGRKLPNTGFHLWKGCMDGDEKSWRLMRKYNAHDVFLLEGVFTRLRPWANININVPTRRGGACPKCGSSRLQSRGFQYTRTSEQRRFQCRDCGGWSHDKPEPLAVKVNIR